MGQYLQKLSAYNLLIQTDRQNTQINIQAGTQTDRHTHTQIGRQTDWQMGRPTDRHVHLHNSSNLLRCICMCAQNTVRRWFSSVSGQSHSVSCGAILPVIGYTRTETEKSRVMQVSLLLPFKFTVSKHITAKEYIGNSKVLASLVLVYFVRPLTVLLSYFAYTSFGKMDICNNKMIKDCITVTNTVW